MARMVRIRWHLAESDFGLPMPWFGAWLVGDGGEEGEWFHSGRGAAETASEAPAEATGVRLRFWPSKGLTPLAVFVGFLCLLSVLASAAAACSGGDEELARAPQDRSSDVASDEPDQADDSEGERQGVEQARTVELEAELDRVRQLRDETLALAADALVQARADQARIEELEAEIEAVRLELDDASSHGRRRTLRKVIDRGELLCGVRHTQPLFSLKSSRAEPEGFGVEFCKAIAVAVLDDASAVRYVDIDNAWWNGLGLLNDEQIDVLLVDVGVTRLINKSSASSDRELGADFTQAVFHTGQAFAVRRNSGITSIPDLDGATICVRPGMTTEQNLADHFVDLGLSYTPLGGQSADVADAFFGGHCDALTADASDLASLITARDNAGDYMMLDEIISKWSLALAVRDYDSEWKDVVNWVVHGLIAAEEMGITSRNVGVMARNPPNTAVARLLGVSFEGSSVATLGFDSVDAQFLQRAIAAVGNYGEIYDRTIGDTIPRDCTLNALAIDASVDCPAGQGGILYALPYR